MLDPQSVADLHELTSLPPKYALAAESERGEYLTGREEGSIEDLLVSRIAECNAIGLFPPSLSFSGSGPMSIADICRGTLGVLSTHQHAGKDLHFRAAPSAGNCHPVQMYAIPRSASHEADNYYRFDAQSGRLRSGYPPSPGSLACDEADLLAGVTFVFSAEPLRSTNRYGLPGLRYSIWDAGSAIGNLLVLLRKLKLRHGLYTAIDEGRLASLLNLDPLREVPLAVVEVQAFEPGVRRRHKAAANSLPATLRPPMSFRGQLEEDPPHPGDTAAERLHHLVGADEILSQPASRAHWRKWARSSATEPRASMTNGGSVVKETQLSAAIPLTGAARLFRRESVYRDAMSGLLWCAEKALPLDFSTAQAGHLRIGVAVHAVDGEHPGYHRVEGGVLYPLTEVSEARVRACTRTICLGQALAQDAAFAVLFFASLSRLQVPRGARLYKSLLLEAAARGQHMRLAATIVGMASSPLAFRDESAAKAFPGFGECLFAIVFGHRDRIEAPPGRGHEFAVREMALRNSNALESLTE